jgi:hypothetical protein
MNKSHRIVKGFVEPSLDAKLERNSSFDWVIFNVDKDTVEGSNYL